MDGSAALPCSHRPTPPNSPIDEPYSPKDHVKPAVLDTTKPQKDGLSSSEQVAALLKLSGELAAAVERLTKAPNTASWGKKEDEPEIEPGSTLGYKRVDEMYVSMSRRQMTADTLIVGTKGLANIRSSGQMTRKPKSSINMCL